MWFKKKKSKYPNPCNDGKCLRYPICIAKDYVYCELLEPYVDTFTRNNKNYRRIQSPVDYPEFADRYYKDLWKDLHIFLPNTNSIMFSQTRIIRF